MQSDHDRGLSPADLFSAVGTDQLGSVKWFTPVPNQSPGVYIVSLHTDRNIGSGLTTAPLDSDALERWHTRCPGLTVHGRRVGVDPLGSHLAQW